VTKAVEDGGGQVVALGSLLGGASRRSSSLGCKVDGIGHSSVDGLAGSAQLIVNSWQWAKGGAAAAHKAKTNCF